MNSTTGLELSSDLIFSTTSIETPYLKRWPLTRAAVTPRATRVQFINQLPLLGGTHRQPAADFRTGAQASGTKPLRV
jgi:hypothetical protein